MERARRAGAAWDVDQVPGAGRVDVERLTAVLMDARTCSRVRTHGRGRRCGVGSQGHGGPSSSLERSYRVAVPLQIFGIEDERTQRYAKKEVGGVEKKRFASVQATARAAINGRCSVD